jgi:hypothetical protein
LSEKEREKRMLEETLSKKKSALYYYDYNGTALQLYRRNTTNISPFLDSEREQERRKSN